MKEEEYNLHTRHHIPKDYKGCWNCRYMQWMVALGQGARCSNKKNEYRVFREVKDNGKYLIFHHSPYYDTRSESRLKLPLIPGVAKKCEHFVNKYEKVI
jgi:hypothetical protein